MAGGRSTTPLFDLLSRGGPAAARVSAPARPRPVREPVRPAPGVRPEPPEAEDVHEPTFLRLPMNTVYIAVAVVLVLLLGAWIGGVKWGSAREAARVERELGDVLARPAVNEPGTVERPASPAPAQPERREAARPAPGPGATPPRAIPAGRVLGATGDIADPRESGLNYLALAVLPREDAVSAMAFLSENNVGSFAVPVDAKGAEVNNPGPVARYRLYALPGVTRDELRSNQTVVTNLEARIAQVGPAWQKERRGSSNFAKPGWMKHQ
ncbi:MAG: hypothetical protein SFY69_12235 [Planctomycetota bacterium]|nr:hypothetical protein [Planctomycetota bacterium]